VNLDVISIVEAAYDLEPDTRGWLSQLLERVAPGLDRGRGLGATIYRLDRGPDEATVVSRAMSPETLDALLTASVGDDDSHRIVGAGMALRTTTQTLQKLGLSEPEARSHKHLVNLFYPLGVRDVLALSVPEPTGFAVLIVAPMPDTRRPSPREAGQWARIAAHIAAGARLRDSGAAAGASRLEVAEGTDAVLTPSGAVEHATPDAQPRRVRESLRAAVRAVDRARSKERSDPERALELWQGLVAGRWSLVDRFDSDGRRFVVARRNDPELRDPRVLTRRERLGLAYAAMGHPLKLIAYSLGLSVSTIALHRGRAMRKLGLTSMADVTQLFAQKDSR
jgi:DNA-binding NarL/FixJ family response regulator